MHARASSARGKTPDFALCNHTGASPRHPGISFARGLRASFLGQAYFSLTQHYCRSGCLESSRSHLATSTSVFKRRHDMLKNARTPLLAAGLVGLAMVAATIAVAQDNSGSAAQSTGQSSASSQPASTNANGAQAGSTAGAASAQPSANLP